MKEPPVMISTKDLSYISDIFEWNFVVSKTASHFMSEIEDEDISSYMEKVSKMHSNICRNLARILEDNDEQ
jgi:hypothetical protein